jgi:hypothetical protein
MEEIRLLADAFEETLRDGQDTARRARGTEGSFRRNPEPLPQGLAQIGLAVDCSLEIHACPRRDGSRALRTL